MLRAIQLREIVTSLGPAYIKLGQVRHLPQGWAAAGCAHLGGRPSLRRAGEQRMQSGRQLLITCTSLTQPHTAPPSAVQALSIRPDLLSPAAMGELQKLCDKVPSFDSAIAMQVSGLRGVMSGKH